MSDCGTTKESEETFQIEDGGEVRGKQGRSVPSG